MGRVEMGRKPTGKPNGRPKKKATTESLHLAWEMAAVPHQSDLHHYLYDIAAAFEAGPDWFSSIEGPLTLVFGKKAAAHVQQGIWNADGSDFYALIEKAIERTAFTENKGSEGDFMVSVVRNCARGFISKHSNHFSQNDVGEILGRAFEKIIVAGTYNPTSPIGKKILYLKNTVKSAGFSVLRERSIGKKLQQKEITAKHRSKRTPLQTFTFEDFLCEIGLKLQPKAKKAG